MIFNLHFFDGEGMGETITAGDTPQQTGDITDNSSAAESVTSNTLEDKRKAYDEMIKGEYKEFYTQDTQKMIDRRFKETKELEAKVANLQPLMDALSLRYNSTDTKAILEAMDNDNAYWEEAADEAGMTVEQYKQVIKLKQENERLMAAQRARENEERVNLQVQDWIRQSETLKQTFPNFDLNAELENQEFTKLLQSNVPVEHAYKLIHYDEIVSALQAATANNVEKAVVSNVRAKGARPQENGTSSQSAFTVKDDVSKLTKADRAELARRAGRGEKITF